MNRTCIIMNPAARGTKAGRIVQQLETLTAGTDLKMTARAGDARRQAEEAVREGYEVVVAAGGDGTINEVVNGIGLAPVTLGILPVGTVNVFAMELGVPFNLESAWRTIREGRTREVDLADANGHYFVQMAGIGLDAEVVARTDPQVRQTFGPISYLLTATQVCAEPPPQLRVSSEAGSVAEGSFVLVGNGRFYGGPFALFNEADPQDGRLDVCVFPNINYLAVMNYLRGILFGGLSRFSDVAYFQAERLTVETDRPVPLEADGELVGRAPVEFRVHPRALRVLVPD